MTGSQLRQKYLEFFAKQGHKILPSASLVPDNDPTTLFTGSGMQPMLPYFLGEVHPEGNRIVDSQRCFRAEDLEEVGDNRHTTAFEMLGNWSLGDYFKKEQLHWFWEFLTKEVGIDPRNLYVTVFAGDEKAGIGRDDEAIAIWQELFKAADIEAKLVDDAEVRGMQGGRIFAYPAKKNWWSRSGTPDKMPTGEPGGPDSEVFYEFDEVAHDPAYGEHCHVNCDCGRYLEIGNNVFMQFKKMSDGSFEELPQKNIDFGGGLERVLAAATDTSDVFKTDLFWPIIEKIKEVSGKPYEGDYQYAYRVISDHLKAAVWLASDGVVPSNKMQGYVMRRLIRRAVRFGRALEINKPYTAEVVGVIQNMYSDQYPQVLQSQVAQSISEEEVKFLQTLDRGLREVQKVVDTLDGSKLAIDDVAARAFDFYQTLGLPVDIFIDELMSRGGVDYSIDERQEIAAKAQQLFSEHQELSRQGSAGMFKGGLGGHSSKEIQYHTATHLLQQALRDVLGDTVQQRGSNITTERLRFDFTSERRLTPEEKQEVENIVNQKIAAKLPVSFRILPLAEAQNSGSIGLFGEKYGETVKVFSIGGSIEGKRVSGEVEGLELAGEADDIAPRDEVYSREFCGGPHVANTAEIKGTFKIKKDEKVSRDVVRIKAVLE